MKHSDTFNVAISQAIEMQTAISVMTHEKRMLTGEKFEHSFYIHLILRAKPTRVAYLYNDEI